MNELVNMFKMKNLPREVTYSQFTQMHVGLVESVGTHTKVGHQVRKR